MKTKLKRTLWLGFDRALSHNLLRQLLILCVVLTIALLASYLLLSLSNAEWEQFCDDKHLNKWLLPLYLLIDSNALNTLYIGGNVHGWMLFASSITFLFGAFVFNGIIIGIITNSIERRVKEHQEGRLHYLQSGHYIIMGYDEMVSSFVSYIFDKDKDAYILILSAKETVGIRENLLKSFTERQMERVIINYGHRISTDAYQDIYLEAAEEVFVIGNHSNKAHDAINVECVDSIYRYLNNPKITQRPARITCVFNDLDTYAAFKTSNIFEKVEKLGVEFVPYNFYAGWAKRVFVKRKYKDFDEQKEYKYPLVYGKGIKPEDKQYAHLVFVGTTNFAVAFAMEAAHVLHFPNAKKAKTLITFIDVNADDEKDEFITRNRHFFEVQQYYYRDLSRDSKNRSLQIRDEYVEFTEAKGYGKDASNFLDVEFEFIKGNVFSKDVQDLINEWGGEHGDKQYLSVFLALADQRENFLMGMNMPDTIYDKAVPIFIRQDRSDNFVTNLRTVDEKERHTYSRVKANGELEQKERSARYANFYPFGMNETAFCADDHSLKRAKLINYLYNNANYTTNKFPAFLVLDAIPEETIWAEADALWQKLSVALKWSNLYNSYTMRTKLRTLRAMRGVDIDDVSQDYNSLQDSEVEQLAVVEHNRWNVEKLLMGYRKAKKSEDRYENEQYAGKLKKNKDLFIHHDIKPFEALGDIKVLDYEFCRYIPWIMKMTEK